MFVRLAVINVNYKIISSYKFIWGIGKKKKKGKREREKEEEKNKEKTKHDLKYPKEKGNPKKNWIKNKIVKLKNNNKKANKLQARQRIMRFFL